MRFITQWAMVIVTGAAMLPACKSKRSSDLKEEIRPACSNWNDSSVQPACKNPFVVTASDQGVGVKENECSYYLRLRSCLSDCSEYEKNRLLGYYQTCMGVTGLAAGDYQFVTGCADNPQFKQYTVKMRSCLQRASVRFNEKLCRSCREVIEGSGSPYDGIIGSHTPCNGTSDFCTLTPDSLRCFGAGLGSSWQGVAGNHSVTGSLRSVGFCHLISQAASCASSGLSGVQSGYAGFMQFWRSLCSGYQSGCIAMQSQTGTTAGNVVQGIFGTGGATVDKASCKAACPLPEDLNRITAIGGDVAGYLFEKLTSSIGRGGVLTAEESCRSVIGFR